MATSIREHSRPGLQFGQSRQAQSARVRVLCAASIIALVVSVTICASQQSARLRSIEASQDCPQPGAKIDLAFIIDRSGSLDVKVQGQTYNVEIEGVRRAILDPSLVPRDATIAIAVFTFAGSPTLQAPLTEIKSEADAVALAAKVEALKCVSAETCPLRGPNRETNAGPALLAANQQLSDNKRVGAPRIFLMSTDGGFTDADFAATTSRRIREATPGIASEVDVILLGLFADPKVNPDQCPPIKPDGPEAAKCNIRGIVFPGLDSDLPGARLDIDVGACNSPDALFGSECEGQVRNFVELTRRVLRSQPPTRFLTVNTDADTDPGAPATDGTLSLRQAIERANNGGATTITFDAGLLDKSIRPRVPLPALTAPDIRICGCNEAPCDYVVDHPKKCDRFVTIDGSKTDPTKGEQHSDGLFIRSDRAVVRGLRIIKFARAGVTIEPVCNLGFNRIELNRFEDNTTAGVRVLDSAGAPGHNVGNTISMNDILGSQTPIDLGADGPTTNDPEDPDSGPNTLLNFPDTLSAPDIIDVAASASGVTLTGQANGPTAAGATVEIFAITSFLPVPGGRVIDGVTFLKHTTTYADGSFTVTGLADSPTCGYTATLTDLAGNTSELMFPCGGFPKARVTNPDFGGMATPNQTPQTGSFSIENTGCAPLKVSFASIRRDDFSQRKPAQLARSDDAEHFSIQSIIVGNGGQTITIEAGQKQLFTAEFDPAIPRVFKGRKPSASLILPDTVNSTLQLAHNGCVGSDSRVSLIAQVGKNVKLIDPDKPRNNPVITLTRSEDVFTVVFSIYDSNQDLGSVVYEFFDKAGGSVDLIQPDRDLSRVVEQARADGRLRIGQSFSIQQTFTNANQHRDVATVTVTVSDKEGSSAKWSGSISPLTANVQSRVGVAAEVVMPGVKLETNSRRKARRSDAPTISTGIEQPKTLVRRGPSRAPRKQSQQDVRRISK